ncbi:proteasome regulatory non-ATPase subunit, putative [Bodo saltans]|uniref:Proteasome regulatory non-ATPase subunit, putative n=1 Tax=Bodo saltans TaxID=75058 RepID=A0A0S4J927_BODSA|nr:proteasome regulatory non-ATPase subunit, putative [Bodo saltans]|eukprot:CUG88009.1 proteasome regulatory non-ATPase subunit, putative [Bodo saltans]
MDGAGSGDVGMTVRMVAEKFRKLKTAYDAKDDMAAEDVLDEVKQKIIFFPTFLNVSTPSPTRAQEILLVREIFEHGLLLSARKKDVEEMERYFNLLRTYYDDVEPSVVPESSVMHLIVGLNLMRLLVCHKIAEFHTELERIPADHQRNQYLRLCSKKDVEEMERYFNLLRTYYDDVEPSVVPESSVMHLIVGLNLMRLLVCHKIAEFHTELERIPADHQRNQYLRFAMQMERYLMEGSYNKLLHARGQAPSNEYVSVVELLEGTVRAEVSRCMPAAYSSISVQEASATLMIKSESDVRLIAERNGWKTSADGVQFEFSRDVDASKRELPFMQVLQQQIAFAADLQRVV